MAKKTTPVTERKPKTFYTIEKINMTAYRLIKLTIDEAGNTTEEVLHRNSPPIVYSKLLVMIKNQGFSNDDI